MSTITSLSDLASSPQFITEEQITAIINALHIKMYNITHGGGDDGAIDTQTFGATGIKIDYSKSLSGLMEQMKFYQNLLENPQQRGDFAIGFSQSSPVEFTPHVANFPIRHG